VSVGVSFAFRSVCLLSGTASDSAAVPLAFENSAAWFVFEVSSDVVVAPAVFCSVISLDVVEAPVLVGPVVFASVVLDPSTLPLSKGSPLEVSPCWPEMGS